jgi:phage recombination protein Bet
MSNVTRIAPTGLYDAKTLALIKRTVASDCNDDEFSLFIHMSRHMGLDPLRRQIFAFVFSKDDPKKRRMSIVIAIDGFRAIAERTGAYRPDEDEPTLDIDEASKGANNPFGLVKATVRVWKFAHGGWHKVTGVAYWDEIAPIKEEWAYDEAYGKRKPTGRMTLDTSGQWGKMGRLMLSKAAEAQALRKAFPDDFSNVYEMSEIDRAKATEALPADVAAAGAVQERLEKIGARDTVPLIFDERGAIELVPVGAAADRCFQFIDANKDEPSAILTWQERNRAGLKELWAKAQTDALAVKRKIETTIS